MFDQQLAGATRFDPVMPKRVAWFCIRSQQKHEKIAAGHLGQIEEVDVFSPRIRFPRSTQQGPVWVTESMFPNYLFARFDWQKSLARVHYAPGVKHIVHFGARWPTVPDEVIEELRAHLGSDQLHVIDVDFQTGDSVELSGGPFHGLRAVITQVMSGGRRIAVLMDFLGRQTMIEVSASAVLRERAR